MIIYCVMLSKNCLYDGGPLWESYMGESDTLGLPNDHMLNYTIFDVVIELVYFLIKTKHFGPYWHIFMYISIHTLPLQGQ